MDQNTNDNRQAILKTSFFGGFDKKEVLAYIDRLREENAASQAALDQQLNEVTAARNELGDQVTGFEQKIGEMGTQLDERSNRIRELTDEIDRLQKELNVSKKTAGDTSRALVLQKEQNRILLERATRSEEQAKRYEDVSAQLGDILLTARQNAGEIVSAAQEEATRIRSDATNAGALLTEKLVSMREGLGEMREKMNEIVENFSDQIDEIEAILDEMEGKSADQAPDEPSDEAAHLTSEEPETPSEKRPAESAKVEKTAAKSSEETVSRVMRELDQKRTSAGSFLNRLRYGNTK